MANSVYQRAIEQLEGVLSPRVASQSLQEGLKKLQKTPDTVMVEDVETILKAQVYRRLQVTLPPDKAKETVQELLEGLQNVPQGDVAGAGADLQGQAEDIKALKDALKPFNLYFEWPETQKLRAQLQLLEAEQEAGRDAHDLVNEAWAQLGVMEQKLEGQLVTQAKELGELKEAFKQVKSLGGSKVRRLENLIGQIESAQETRQSASGEVERARKIATDLRKLVASAVLEPSEDVSSAQNRTSAQTNRVSEELKRLDLDNDARELERLTGEFANLFLFEPALAEHVARARATLAAQTPLGEGLGELRETLSGAQSALREALRAELGEIAAYVATLEGVDAHELEVALPVTLSVLETTLPARADVQRVRDLHGLLTVEGTDDPERAAQIAELHQLESEAAAYVELDDDAALQLALLLDASRTQLEVGREAVDLSEAWPLLKEVREVVAQRAATFEPRLDAALEAFEPIASLNTDETLNVKRTLRHLDAQRAAFGRVTPRMQAQLITALSDAEATLQELQGVWEATRDVAGQLVSGNMFDDILGIFGSDEPSQEVNEEVKVETADPEASAEDVEDLLEPDAKLRDWLATVAQLQGVSGAALFLPEGRVTAGAPGVFPPPFHRAVRALARDLSKLGDSLKVGSVRIHTLELPSHTVITAWPNENAYLSLIVTTPAMVSPTLKTLRGELPGLRDLLHSLHDPAQGDPARPGAAHA